jgi:hypothetical protein
MVSCRGAARNGRCLTSTGIAQKRNEISDRLRRLHMLRCDGCRKPTAVAGPPATKFAAGGRGPCGRASRDRAEVTYSERAFVRHIALDVSAPEGARCHQPAAGGEDLERVRLDVGPTVFDWLVEIIEVHGAGDAERVGRRLSRRSRDIRILGGKQGLVASALQAGSSRACVLAEALCLQISEASRMRT